MSGKKLLIIIPLLLIVGLAIVGAINYDSIKARLSYEKTDNAKIMAEIFPVSTRIGGVISEVLVQDNQFVKKGQVLVRLEQEDYRTEVVKSKVNLEIARKESQAAKSGIRLAEKNKVSQLTQSTALTNESQASINSSRALVLEAQAALSESEAKLEENEVSINKARTDFSRLNGLYEKGLIAQQQVDDAKSTLDSLLTQKKQTNQLILQYKSRVAQANADVKMKEAQSMKALGIAQQEQVNTEQVLKSTSDYGINISRIKQAEIIYQEANRRLLYTNIVAPADGYVGKKNVVIKQIVQPGQPLLAVVGRNKWINANFQETQLKNIEKNNSVIVNIDAIPQKEFQAKVQSFAPASGAMFSLLPPEDASGNFTKIIQRIPVKIVFDPKSIKGYEDKIIPGMSAVVYVKNK